MCVLVWESKRAYPCLLDVSTALPGVADGKPNAAIFQPTAITTVKFSEMPGSIKLADRRQLSSLTFTGVPCLFEGESPRYVEDGACGSRKHLQKQMQRMRNDLTADIKTCSCLKALIVLFGLIQTFIHPSPAPITLIRMSPHRFVIFTRVGRLFCLKYRNIIFSKEKKSLFHAVVQYCQFNFSPWYNNVQVLFYFFQDNVTPSENTADNAKGRT